MEHDPNEAVWRYLNYDPKAVEVFEKSLGKEACSVVTWNEIVYGEKRPYKIRTFCIRSFDSLPGKIAISERSHGHNLLIEGPGDKIKIEDISGLVKLHFLRPELLEVVYSPRGGSDQGFEYVIILGIIKQRLWVVTEFLTINEASAPDGYSLHEVRLKLEGQTLHDCRLTANVRDLFKSDSSSVKSYDRKSATVLEFDEKRRIFYQKIGHLNAVFLPNSRSPSMAVWSRVGHSLCLLTFRTDGTQEIVQRDISLEVQFFPQPVPAAFHTSDG